MTLLLPTQSESSPVNRWLESSALWTMILWVCQQKRAKNKEGGHFGPPKNGHFGPPNPDAHDFGPDMSPGRPGHVARTARTRGPDSPDGPDRWPGRPTCRRTADMPMARTCGSDGPEAPRRGGPDGPDMSRGLDGPDRWPGRMDMWLGRRGPDVWPGPDTQPGQGPDTWVRGEDPTALRPGHVASAGVPLFAARGWAGGSDG